MKEIGIKINNMDTVKKYDKILISMKDRICKVRKMERVEFIFLMALIMKAIFEIINIMGMEN